MELERPDIMVQHWDYGIHYLPREFEGEVVRNAIDIGATNIRVMTSDKYAENPSSPVFYKEFFGKVISGLIHEGYDCAFVGLRKEESLKRKRRINKGESLTQITERWPLASWTWLDVWAYIISNDIPYLSTYDTYAPVVGWEHARFSTFFDPEFDKLGNSNLDGIMLWKQRHALDFIKKSI